MKNYYSLLATIWLTAICACGPAHAERDIVFSAQYYGWSGQFFKDPYEKRAEETLKEKGNAHLYRINPDGSKRTRLTFGRQDDYRPLWSPDGTRILFTRYRADGKVAVCTIGAAAEK